MKRKILLLSDCPPNKHYSGSLMTVSLLKLMPDYDFSCYITVDPKLDHKDFEPSLPNFTKKIVFKRSESEATLLSYYLDKFFFFPKMARKIIRFAKKNEVDAIWSILQGQNMVCLTDIIIKKSKLPVKVQIWDSLEWWLRARQIKEFFQKKYLATFDNVIRRANKVLVASFNMADDYKKKYNRDCNILVSFLDKEKFQNLDNINHLNNKEEFVIGFCGQLYAKNNFISLVKALDSIDWKINGKLIKLRMMTYIRNISDLENYLDNIKIDPKNVELPGWIETSKVVEMLNKCDLLYCPYWFDEEFKLESSTSFPSKLTTYLAAGKPVMIHAPEYSSPYSFLKKYEAGLFCNSLSLEHIVESINSGFDDNLTKKVLQNANKAFDDNLTSARARKQMESFLSI